MRSTDLWRRTLNAVSTQATATIKQALGAPSTTRSAVPADQPLHWEWLARACSPASTVPVHVRSATCAALSNRSSSAHAAADSGQRRQSLQRTCGAGNRERRAAAAREPWLCWGALQRRGLSPREGICFCHSINNLPSICPKDNLHAWRQEPAWDVLQIVTRWAFMLA